MPDKHLSTQFDSQLNNVSMRVMELGGLVESQIRQAVYALSEFSVEVADQVIADEARVNMMEVDIDRELASIIGRRQPTAVDLRLLLAISKTTANLERVGDEAERIARMVKSIIADGMPRALPSSDLRTAIELASALLRKALDAFARLDAVSAVEILREDGRVMDDGTVARLGEQHWFMTTTTANAVAVYQHMQHCHQVLWPELDVQFTSVTEHWAQFAVAGPRSRELLQRVLAPGEDISNGAFPYMAARAVTLADGLRGRLFRLSFSGELAYEIAVPARRGDALIRRLFEAGRDLGVVPYGLEALGVMRIEKGHVAGNELTGRTSAQQLGLGRMLSTKKDYIGARLARLPALDDPADVQLVGLKPLDRSARLVSGAHFLPLAAPSTFEHEQGHVTSVAYSPSLGHWIALGLLKDGRQRHGERLRAVDLLRGQEAQVEVCDPVFIDPQGERLRG